MSLSLSGESRDFLQKLHAKAEEFGHEFILPEHLLFLFTETPVTEEIFKSFQVPPGEIRNRLVDFFERKVERVGENCEISFSSSVLRIFSHAEQQVVSSGRRELEVTDLLVSLFLEEQSYAVYLLRSFGMEFADVLSAVTGITHPEARAEDGKNETEDGEGKKRSALELYTVNLTELARAGKLDAVIGRSKELGSVLRTLSRRKKNNPLLVGEPGVGKTAVVEGLAVRIAHGEVPEQFENLVIYALDMGALTAGTKFRGQFEERLKNVIRELSASPDHVLFIDEIHTVIGAGAVGSGSLDASNILKPSLNRGELRCIGATTNEEYRNQLLKDKAFSRRFQKIDVPEPSSEESLQILSGIAPAYGKHYDVSFEPETLKRIVELAERHIFDRFMPDKAIDLLDEAGAANRMAEHPLKTIPPAFVEHLAAEMFGIPETQTTGGEAERLRVLDAELRKVVIGQDPAIDAVVSAIKLSRSGLSNADRPVGAFLFAGPTGVGKTELSKRLASTLGIGFVRFDMSEYAEEYSISKLIGSSPGYVGFEQGGLLTERILRCPHCVLLLDEMEKAHPKIYNLMLQIMDYGVMTDNSGRRVDFRNVILIMTTNVGARSLAEHAIGFQAADQTDSRVESALRKHFPPEFRNRLDGMIPFHPLSPESIRKIVRKFLSEAEDRLRKRGIALKADGKAVDWLAEHGFDEKLGARPLERLIRDEILAKLADTLLFQSEKGVDTVRISAGKDGITLKTLASGR